MKNPNDPHQTLLDVPFYAMSFAEGPVVTTRTPPPLTPARTPPPLTPARTPPPLTSATPTASASTAAPPPAYPYVPDITEHPA